MREVITLAQVQRVVADAFEVTVADLLGRHKPYHVALARHAAMYLSRERTRHSSTALGRAFGRDHSTILASVARARDLMATDHAFAQRVNQARDHLDKIRVRT